MEFAPNPVHNQLQVNRQSAEPMQYWIYNAQGQLILSGTVNQQQAQISTVELRPGIYYFTTQKGNRRFIKE